VIYFIHDAPSRAIKIGHGWNPRGRLSTFQISTPNKLTILGTIAGTKRTEQKVHGLVCRHCAPKPGEAHERPLCLRGEWFDDRILPFVNELMADPERFLGADRAPARPRPASRDASLHQGRLVLAFDSGEVFRESFVLRAPSVAAASAALGEVAAARLPFLAYTARIARLSVAGLPAREVGLRGAFVTRRCEPRDGLSVAFNSNADGWFATDGGVKQYANRWLHGVPDELCDDTNGWRTCPTDQFSALLRQFAQTLTRNQCVISEANPLTVLGLVPRAICVLPRGELRSKANRRAAARKRQRPAEAPPRDRAGVVYFIQDTSNLAVKVGFCLRDPARRMADLQVGNANLLRLIGHAPGLESQEKILHDAFSRFHLQGEWFSPAILGDVSAILRCGSIGGWIALQDVNLPPQAATATRLSDAGRAAVILAPAISPAREGETAEPEPAFQSARRHAAADDVPWTRPRPATGPELDDDDDLPHWARKRER
jgi:hypothetical protein